MALLPQSIDQAERRLMAAALGTPVRQPWLAEERREIAAVASECLGIREEWVPQLGVRAADLKHYGEVVVELLQAESWPGCQGAAHLWRPAHAATPLPLVLLCCGHGRGCKQAAGYQAMAWRLACAGAAVLVADNIGQGEREAMGHADVVGPFACGISLQGLIVMEAMAWLDWLRANGRFDTSRLAAIGNSGGGTLTLFLAALRREQLAAVSSSGYPSSFEFIARKEKKHCHCNVLPGIIGKLEMWHLLGCFAPKPLFIFQGRGDHLFPPDLFWSTARKTASCYQEAGVPASFKAEVFDGTHRWDEARREALAGFLTHELKLQPGTSPPFPADPPGQCYANWPHQAINADQLARLVTGRDPGRAASLADVYLGASTADAAPACCRASVSQIVAQYQAFMGQKYISKVHAFQKVSE